MRDRATHAYNAGAIARYSRQLAAAVGSAVIAGYFPLVLGGDCSILLRDLVAFGGRYGLLFVDGHTDCYEPSASTGELAELELGIAMGLTHDSRPSGGAGRLQHGWSGRVMSCSSKPETARSLGGRPAPPHALTIDLAQLARLGIDAAVNRGLERRCHDELDGFWVHLDVNVLDDLIVPAVDYRLPGGLSCDDLVSLLRAAVRCGRAVAEITIFNPSLDPDHAVRRRLVAELTRALRSEQSDRR